MVEHNNSEHKYFTRSKTTDDKIDNHDLDIIDDMDDIDNYGNLKDFIDYDCEEDLDVDMLKDEISRLNGDTKRKKMETENIDKKKEIEKIILVNVPSDIYSNLRKIFLFVFESSGFKDIKISNMVDFQKLYDLKKNQ